MGYKGRVGKTFYKGCAVTALAVLVISLKSGIRWYNSDGSVELPMRSFDLYHRENAYKTFTGRLTRHLMQDDLEV